MLTPVLVAAVLAGGYYESTYSLLAAGVWLGLATVASVKRQLRQLRALQQQLALCE